MSNVWTRLGQFPSTDHLVRGSWAPLYFEPIPGSGERLTIAIVVVGQAGAEVVVANRISALGCLFPNDVERLEFFVRTAVEAIEADVNLRGMEALTRPRSPMSGIYLGEPRESLGESIKDIATSWLKKSSSLMSNEQQDIQEQLLEDVDYLAPPIAMRSRDHLPLIVYDGVVKKMPFLATYFREDIQEGRTQRRSQHDSIDYCGRNIVVNFYTLRASRLSVSRVHSMLKPPLWDLNAYRNKSPSYLNASFEMHVQRPASYDTQFTQNEHRRVAQVLASLEIEARMANITLRPYSSAAQMVDRIIEAEAA